MQIVAEYSFNGGKEFIYGKHAPLLDEMREAVAAINKRTYYTRIKPTDTKYGLQDPASNAVSSDLPQLPAVYLMRDVLHVLAALGWKECFYEGYMATQRAFVVSTFLHGRKPPVIHETRYLGMSKDRLGMNFEAVQFVDVMFNVAQMFTVFKNLGLIDAGLLVVPTYTISQELQLYGSYYELFVTDLMERGVLNPEKEPPFLVWGFE